MMVDLNSISIMSNCGSLFSEDLFSNSSKEQDSSEFEFEGGYSCKPKYTLNELKDKGLLTGK